MLEELCAVDESPFRQIKNCAPSQLCVRPSIVAVVAQVCIDLNHIRASLRHSVTCSDSCIRWGEYFEMTGYPKESSAMTFKAGCGFCGVYRV